MPRHFLRRPLRRRAAAASTDGSGRRELAEAIVNRENPLTARVIVNRVWALHFGRRLVAHAEQLRPLGEPPTHPELLDDLAVRFMENGWSLKWLEREIVLSATYRQSERTSTPTKLRGRSARTVCSGRMNRRRLTVEAVARCAARRRPARSTGGRRQVDRSARCPSSRAGRSTAASAGWS